MVSEQLNGFLLHKRSYRETSYLVDIFTYELGKVSAVVRGVRGGKGDKKSLLQPFQPLLMSVSGKHELRNLNQLESAGSSYRLSGKMLFSAMYINEVLNRLLPKEVPHPELFTIYQNSLEILQNSTDIEPCLRQFELNLLDDLGYGVDLRQDFELNEPIQPTAEYCFVLEHGLKRIGLEYRGTNRMSGEDLLHVSEHIWTPGSLQCAKKITRTSLAHILGPKPLKSRELFQQTWNTGKNSTTEGIK